MFFLNYFLRIFRDHPVLILSISGLMAIVAITEGVVIALVAPLLSLAFNDTLRVQENEGFLAYATNYAAEILTTFNFEPSLGLILAIIIGIFFIQGSTRFFQKYLQWKMIEQYEFSLIHNLFQRYLNSSWSFFVDNKLGHLINVLTMETHRAVTAFKFTLQALAHFFLILFYLLLSLLVSWKITLLGIVLGGLASIFLKTFIGRMEHYGSRTSEINSRFHALALDMLSSAKMLKASSTEKKALKQIDTNAREKAWLDYTSQMNGSLIPSFYLPLVMGMLALIVYVSIGYWDVSLAMLIVFLYIFYRLIPALSTLHSDYQQALIFIPALNEIDALQEATIHYQEKSGHIPFAKLKTNITFKDVSFRYHQDTWVLENLNVTIPKGGSIAIVGASGAGKTSLVDLLLGMFTPTKGSILVDNTPLKDYAVSTWRKRIGYMSQDVFLLNTSIKENLMWIAPHATRAGIHRALKGAYAYEFVSALPQGINTLVGDRGVKLSGGQRQRIALARLILQNPDIVVLDEAMSALDSYSESVIQKALTNQLKGKTQIIISHRLASIKNVGIIYVLEKGRIVEQGTWSELMKKKGALSWFQYHQKT